jgi:hypothetical protein
MKDDDEDEEFFEFTLGERLCSLLNATPSACPPTFGNILTPVHSPHLGLPT